MNAYFRVIGGERYLRPKPSHSVTAMLSSLCSFSRLEYSGSTSTLKHVCDVGR